MDSPCTLSFLFSSPPSSLPSLAAPFRAPLSFVALFRLFSSPVSSLPAFFLGLHYTFSFILPNFP